MISLRYTILFKSQNVAFSRRVAEESTDMSCLYSVRIEQQAVFLVLANISLSGRSHLRSSVFSNTRWLER